MAHHLHEWEAQLRQAGALADGTDHQGHPVWDALGDTALRAVRTSVDAPVRRSTAALRWLLRAGTPL